MGQTDLAKRRKNSMLNVQRFCQRARGREDSYTRAYVGRADAKVALIYAMKVTKHPDFEVHQQLYPRPSRL